MKRFSVFCGVCALSLFLNSCQTTPSLYTASHGSTFIQAQNSLSSQVKTQSNTRLFDQPVPVAVTANTLVFENLKVPLEKGQVLMGRSLQGKDFLRRVINFSVSGSTTEVKTQAASLFDAFEELQVSNVSTSRSPERITLRSQRFNIGGVMDIIVDLAVLPDFSDASIQLKNSRLKLHLAPRFELDTTIRSELSFLRPAQSELKPVGNVDFTAARFPAWIGPVPVVFRIKPGAALSWGHKASGSLAQNLNIDGFIKPHVELDAALKQNPRAIGKINHEIEARFEPPELKLTGSVRARLYVPQIQFESEIAGIVGPFISAGTYIDANYQKQVRTVQGIPHLETDVSADLGLSVYGGITPTRLFGADLTREIRIKLMERNLKRLYDKKNSEPLS